MPMATPMRSGVCPGYWCAWTLNTGRNMNSPSMRSEKMPESAATARRSIGDSEVGGASTAVPGRCTSEAAASDRPGMLGASSRPKPRGYVIPVAASSLHAGNPFRKRGSTEETDAARDV